MKNIVHSNAVSATAKDNQQSFTIPLPSKIGVNQILIAALIIASFLLGSLMTKVSYLEQGKGSSSAQVATAQTAPQAAVPNQPQVPPVGQKVANVVLGDYTPKGDANAKVKIVEYGDLRCPFCQRFFTDTEPQIISDYVNTGKASFTYVNYAFLGPASIVAANAAECANEQSKFWDFHDYLYKNQPSESDTSIYTTDGMTKIAGQLGMDTTQFQSCLDSKKYDKVVSDDLAAGQKEGVSGTPTTFINGTPIVGAVPYAQIKAEIDKALQ